MRLDCTPMWFALILHYPNKVYFFFCALFLYITIQSPRGPRTPTFNFKGTVKEKARQIYKYCISYSITCYCRNISYSRLPVVIAILLLLYFFELLNTLIQMSNPLVLSLIPISNCGILFKSMQILYFIYCYCCNPSTCNYIYLTFIT